MNNVHSMTRRTALAAIASIPAAPVAMAGEPDTSSLAALIDAHKSAHDALNGALDREWALEADYKERYFGGPTKSGQVLIPLSIGGAVSLHLDTAEMQDAAEDCRQLIEREYNRMTKRDLDFFDKVLSPESKAEVRAIARRMKAQDLRAMRKLAKTEQARQDAHGCGQATRDREDADDAERAAALALLAYPCVTMAEIRMRAEYVMGAGRVIFDSLHNEECFTALLCSALPSAEMAA